jgi:hypothetical protein
MISIPAAAAASVAATAVLAFWLVARYRGLGPQGLRAALIVCALALGPLTVAGRATGAVESAHGTAVALLTIVDPVFCFAFWSAAVLIRAFVAGPATAGR